MAKFTQKGLQSKQRAYSDEATGSVATPLKGLEIQAPSLNPQAAPVDSFVRAGRPNAPGTVQLGQLAKLPEPAEITNLENLSRSLGSLNTNLQNAVNSYLGYEKDRYEEIQLEAQALVATNKEEDYAAIGRVLREKANDPNLSQEERDGANKLLLRLSSDGRLERSVKSELKVQKVLLNAANLNNTLLNSKVTNDEGEAIDLLSVDSSNPLWSQQASQNIYEDLDLSPKEYFWGYNRMMTVDGVFGAGDTVGGTAHKFSSGSFTEGRLAAKAAVQYIKDMETKPSVTEKQINNFKEEVFKPLDNFTIGRNEITAGTVSPSYILPIQGLQRLQKIMDEYCGGITVGYQCNENQLKKGLKDLGILQEDLENIGAEDLHQLMRAWELKHRTLVSQCVTEHTLFREETRWPGYYYRSDKMKLDDENWHCLTLSRRDPETGKFTMEKAPLYHIVDEEKKKAG